MPDNPPLERTAAAVYFSCGRASRVRRRAAQRHYVMPQNHAEHPFDQWIAQFSSASPAQREAMLAVWNKIVRKAVDAAVQERDAFVRAGEYEYAVMARDMAELFGLNAL